MIIPAVTFPVSPSLEFLHDVGDDSVSYRKIFLNRNIL